MNWDDSMARKTDTIQTGRLIFRGIDETDTEKIVNWRSDPEVYKYFKSPHKITIEEHKHWYRNSYLCNEDRFDWICIEKTTGNKIGVFGLVKKNNIAEVNYLLSPEAQHKGYATEGIMQLVQYAAKTWGVKQVIAEIHKENVPSIAAVKKLGFTMLSNREIFVSYGIEV